MAITRTYAHYHWYGLNMVCPIQNSHRNLIPIVRYLLVSPGMNTEKDLGLFLHENSWAVPRVGHS
jgi:hypothetical protein